MLLLLLKGAYYVSIKLFSLLLKGSREGYCYIGATTEKVGSHFHHLQYGGGHLEQTIDQRKKKYFLKYCVPKLTNTS